MKTAKACTLWQWHQLKHDKLQQERCRSQRWKAEMHHATLLQHEVFMTASFIFQLCVTPLLYVMGAERLPQRIHLCILTPCSALLEMHFRN